MPEREKREEREIEKRESEREREREKREREREKRERERERGERERETEREREVLIQHCYDTSCDAYLYLVECFIPNGRSKARAFQWQGPFLKLTLSFLIDLDKSNRR